MKYYHVCPIGVVGGKESLLTYSSDALLQPGTIVQVPFGRSKKNGVVFGETSKPGFATKKIDAVHSVSVPPHLLTLSQWIADYYAAHLGIVLQTALPTGITKQRRALKESVSAAMRKTKLFELNSEQSSAVSAIKNSTSTTHILHGRTGSGKTRVYQELALQQVQNNRSVLVLVPEISLTPQLSAEFKSVYKNTLVIHSAMTESERHQKWLMLSESTEPWVVVGPRSALFSPLRSLGLVIIDECHEPSYQQDSQPKYSALRVARKLVDSFEGAKLVLGSATPLVADYYVAEQTNTPIVRMNLPTAKRSTVVAVVDARQREHFASHPLFSKDLLDSMNKSLAQNEQILLFHNRRGTARLALCAQCGWTAECKNCHLPMRLHHDHGMLRCHICGRAEDLPQTCPTCRSPEVEFKGYGSKRIEAEVNKLYPDAVVARFDSDTPPSMQLHNRYQELYDGRIDIIVGTQGIAKGLDIPNLTTVGVVQADSELFIPDYSSSERSFQLTAQIIGRAGRTGKPSSVVIQTLNPEHVAIRCAITEDYASFYAHELEERLAEHMPPSTYLLQLTTGYASEKSASAAAAKLASQIKRTNPGVSVRGPSPAFRERRGTQYFQQLVVSCSSRAALVAIAKNLPQRWQFTIDPINLL